MAKKSAGTSLVGSLRRGGLPLLVIVALVAYAFGGRIGSSDASAPPFAVSDLQSPPATAGQLIVVSAPTLGTNEATLQAFERTADGWRSVFGPMDAHLGRNGFRADRREGDGTTPTGTFTLTESFGIKPNPGTKLPYRQVGPYDYWVNDSRRPDLYNTWQTYTNGTPPWTAEHLSTFGRSYNHSVVIDFNRGDDMVVGRGSAIFLHVDNGKPTSGCVSIDEAALVRIMQWLDPAKQPHIMMNTVDKLLKVEDAPPVVAGLGGGIRPVAPVRVLDTRTGLGATGPVPARSTIDLQVSGVAGVPRDAVAVALNLTLTEQTEPTYLTVYPAPADPAQGPPLVSNVNARRGEHRANLVMVGLGDAGKVRIYNLTGSAHVVADLVGYVQPGLVGSFQPVTPYRALDTRIGTGRPGTTEPLGPAGEAEVPIAFAPANATAAIVNVTTAKPTAQTYLAAFKGASAWQGTSTVNTEPGEDSANLAVVPIDPATGTIRLRNANGTSHAVVDVQGFIVPGASDFTAALTPVRVLDTRAGIGARGRVAAGSLQPVVVRGLPAGVTAVAVTVTAVDVSRDAFVRVARWGDPPPESSNLNVPAGGTRANLAIVPVRADGRLAVTVNTGDMDVVVDVSGWFTPRP